jgi:hypothetical protein
MCRTSRNCSPDSIGEVHHRKKRQSATIAKQAYPSVFDRVRRLRFLMAVTWVVLLIGTAVATLAKGRLGYYNQYGLTVFAPFALAIGIAALVLAALLGRKKLE